MSQEETGPAGQDAIVVVFRNTLNTEFEADYFAALGEIVPLAMDIPGYLSHKSFVAADGERVTLAEYSSHDAIREWSRHPDHVRVKKLGREKYYTRYSVQICQVLRQHASRPNGDSSVQPAGSEA